ncbi:MAG: hypothetical protein ACRDQ4_08920 [Pseudonocardiaceae bacterium]
MTADRDGDAGAYASASSVSGLARELDTLRTELAALRGVPDTLHELAALVAQIADTTTATPPAGPAGGVGVPSWLDLPTGDLPLALAVLAELAGWLEVVYLRYSDAAAALPGCWLWHPDVVEELLWLMHAWLAAYRTDKAPVSLAADWHDRYRPGVVRRITATTGGCEPLRHQPDGDRAPTPALTVPGAGTIEPLATWWATHRTHAPPQPTREHLADAERDHQARYR